MLRYANKIREFFQGFNAKIKGGGGYVVERSNLRNYRLLNLIRGRL